MSHYPLSIRVHSRGFSIVELMVALTISLILLAGVLTVTYSSKVTYLENERVGRLQESGRAAMEIVLRDVRGAGFPGCAQPIAGLFEINTTVATPNDLLWNLTQPVFGFAAEGTAWNSPVDATVLPDATPGSDIIAVRTVRTGAADFRIPALVGPTDNIVVDKLPGETLAAPVPMVISDCAGATVFVATKFTADADGTSATLEHTDGASNSTDDLGFAFTPGAHVAPIVSIIYYVSPASNGNGPSLWRVSSDTGREEVIQGVELLKVRYGVDTNGDALVDEYVPADLVGANWSNVISVSLAMLIRSNDANSPIEDGKVYTLFNDGAADATAGPFPDHYQRSLFTTTVTLRNRTT
jgi:type IV pilus assembly protein PilW